ncbi:MAG: Hsp70 family protein, partial [Gemmatimonadales bacterium]|nr:Hsp70 family protein [Gemmatimonadales bacterium]
ATDDKTRREQIEARNQLDSLVYRVEKDSKEWVDRLPAETKSRLDTSLETARQALRTGEADGIQKALDDLNTAYSAAGAAMYQSAQSAGPEGGQPGAEPGSPGADAQPGQADVVEADYEIVDEKK